MPPVIVYSQDVAGTTFNVAQRADVADWRGSRNVREDGSVEGKWKL